VKPREFRQIVKNAAGKADYPSCIAYLDEKLPAEMMDLARHTLPYYLPRVIVELPDKAARRKAIESIPDVADPEHTKEFVKMGVQKLWKANVQR